MREFPAAIDFLDRGERELAKFLRAHFLGQRHGADQMMRHFPQRRLVRLRGQQRQAAINLKGVGADNFRAAARRDISRDFGFPARGRADDEKGFQGRASFQPAYSNANREGNKTGDSFTADYADYANGKLGSFVLVLCPRHPRNQRFNLGSAKKNRETGGAWPPDLPVSKNCVVIIRANDCRTSRRSLPACGPGIPCRAIPRPPASLPRPTASGRRRNPFERSLCL